MTSTSQLAGRGSPRGQWDLYGAKLRTAPAGLPPAISGARLAAHFPCCHVFPLRDASAEAKPLHRQGLRGGRARRYPTGGSVHPRESGGRKAGSGGFYPLQKYGSAMQCRGGFDGVELRMRMQDQSRIALLWTLTSLGEALANPPMGWGLLPASDGLMTAGHDAGRTGGSCPSAFVGSSRGEVPYAHGPRRATSGRSITTGCAAFRQEQGVKVDGSSAAWIHSSTET